MEHNGKFLQNLKQELGSTEEFSQFERDFYAQNEELVMLRQNAETMRSALVKLQEEKRVLELKLVSETASREEDSKNALTDLEKNNMQLNTQIYSIKCEVETWKRKAEATLKESGWLKEQLKTLELEKTEAMRKLEGYSRQQSGIEQYRMGLEAYIRRQKDSMADIQTRIVDLEKAREYSALLNEHTETQMKCMAVNLKNREKVQSVYESRIQDLERELIDVKAQLVQNGAELSRIRELQMKTEQLANKLVVENKDVHGGFSNLISALTGQNDTEEPDVDVIFKHIPLFHEEIMRDVENLLKLGGAEMFN